MAQIRKRFDINYGCAKDISTTCGISLDTAQNIVRYRTSYGQYNSVEELLRVPGITKSEHKSVSQVFRPMSGNRMPVVAPRFAAQARRYNASPAADLVLHGLSINNNSNEVHYRQHSAPARRLGHYDLRMYPSGTLRTGKRYRPTSNWQSPPLGTRPATSHPRGFANGYKFQNRYTHSVVSSKSTNDKVISRNRKKASEDFEHVEIVTQSPLVRKRNNKSSAFTVKTSPCGNRINFSCTFDKKMLQEPTSMAFMFNHPKGRDARSTRCTQSAVFVNDKGSSTEGSVVSQLSQENVIIFEKANTPSATDKKQRITQWVRKVNSDRSVYTSSSNVTSFRTAPRSLARSRDSATIIRRVLNKAPANIDIVTTAETNTAAATKGAHTEQVTRARSPHESSVKKSTSKTSVTFEEKTTEEKTSKRVPTPKSSRQKREHKKLKKTTIKETKRQRSTSRSEKQRSTSRSESKRPKSGKRRSARRRSTSRVSSTSERHKYYKYYTKSVRKTDSDSYDGCSVM